MLEKDGTALQEIKKKKKLYAPAPSEKSQKGRIFVEPNTEMEIP